MQHPFHPSRIQHTSCNFLGEKTQSNPPQKDGSGSSGCRGAPPGARAFAPAKLCRINGQSCMWQSCGWKMVCDKIVCEWWRVKKWCVCQIVCVCGKWCVADDMWCVSCKLVSDRWCVTKVVSSEAVCVWEMPCYEEDVWQTFHVAKICERWCETEMVCDRVVGSKQSETTSHCSERRRKSETHPCQTLQPWKTNKN